MNRLITDEQKRESIKELVHDRYEDEFGNPFELTEGQVDIFGAIFGRINPFVHVISYTQYGKTDVCSMAILSRVTAFPEKWAIVAPTKKKTQLMMRYMIRHIFDNRYTKRKFIEKGKKTKEEKILKEKSRERLSFEVGENKVGEVFVVSAGQKSKKKALDSIMGFGAQNIVLDESSLIDDEHYSGIVRMLGGHKDFFMLEIGNPFRRNHFYRSSQDSQYEHILINYKQGLEENRLSEEIVEKARNEPHFDILYKCEFPSEQSADEEGWMPLLTESQLEEALVDDYSHYGVPKLAADISGTGDNYNAVVKRSQDVAELIRYDQSDDTAALAGWLARKKDELIQAGAGANIEIAVDTVGVGKGVFDTLRQQTTHINPVTGGESPDDKERFHNKKSENYWRLREWIRDGGKLIGDKQDWKELLDIKYKARYNKKIQIIPKSKLRDKGIPSPDKADALAMTFDTADRSQSPNKSPISNELEKHKEQYQKGAKSFNRNVI